MRTIISIILFCLCCSINAQTNTTSSNLLLGTWTFTDNESEKADDCFTKHRFVFQQDNKCSYWHDIGRISTGKSNYHRLIFEGLYDYQNIKKEIIIYINGDKDDILKMMTTKLSNDILIISDEAGHQMNLRKEQ